MYIIGLYTHLFKRGHIGYIYNAQSGFFGKVEEELIDILSNRDWNRIDTDTINYLIERHVIESEKTKYDFYNMQNLKFQSRNYDQSTLGLVIAPTTACNFNCPYCFEPKLSPKTISSEKISDLIKFIRLHENAKRLAVTWYGGEPLLAFDKIKEIYQDLKAEDLPRISSQTMITNGSLINEEVCNFFNEVGLNSIQITIDGNEESHNKTRCFKTNRRPSFHIIYENVGLVRRLIPECKILIRVNINKNNVQDFIDLYTKVNNDFRDDSMIRVYPGLIREDTNDGRSLAAHCIQSKDLIEINALLREKGILESIFPEKQTRGCMMFSQNSYIVGPEGELYKCWNDVSVSDKIIGNISDVKSLNTTLLTRYMICCTPFSGKCKDCKIFPICDAGCGYYRYKNLFENGIYDQCSALKEDTILEKALLDGTLSEIVNINPD
ncbi:MAG: radical SAM protein [Muribaculaceae bacterium]|nr:radical SAM protein [Muribaculaceae bacterium]